MPLDRTQRLLELVHSSNYSQKCSSSLVWCSARLSSHLSASSEYEIFPNFDRSVLQSLNDTAWYAMKAKRMQLDLPIPTTRVPLTSRNLSSGKRRQVHRHGNDCLSGCLAGKAAGRCSWYCCSSFWRRWPIILGQRRPSAQVRSRCISSLQRRRFRSLHSISLPSEITMERPETPAGEASV